MSSATDIAALLHWHHLFGWPEIRALARIRNTGYPTPKLTAAMASGQMGLLAIGRALESRMVKT